MKREEVDNLTNPDAICRLAEKTPANHCGERKDQNHANEK